jgi:hypothetical protein
MKQVTITIKFNITEKDFGEQKFSDFYLGWSNNSYAQELLNVNKLGIRDITTSIKDKVWKSK